MTALAITGTRSTDHRDDYPELFRRFVAPHLDRDSTVYVGGAVGIDTLALDWLLAESAAHIVVACPGVVEQQPSRAQESIRAAAGHPDRAEVVELTASESLGEEEYFARNRWMVDRAGMVVGFPRDRAGKGGTWYTLDYAAGRLLPRLIVPV